MYSVKESIHLPKPYLHFVLYSTNTTQGLCLFRPEVSSFQEFLFSYSLSFVACNVSDELRIWVSVSAGISIPILPYLICCLFLIFLVSCRHYLIYHYQAFFTIWIQSISAFLPSPTNQSSNKHSTSYALRISLAVLSLIRGSIPVEHRARNAYSPL